MEASGAPQIHTWNATKTAQVRELVEENGGIVLDREHPELVTAIRWLVRSGELKTVLPGVHLAVLDPHTSTSQEQEMLIRAAARWAPDAVFTGRTAARLSYWPGWTPTPSD